MSIVFYSTGDAGQVGQAPRRNQLVVTDSLSTITTAGYLNSKNTSGKPIFPTDIFDVIYSYVPPTGFKSQSAYGTGTYGVFTPSISNGVIALVEYSGAAVITPTTVADVPVFSTTSGQIKDSGAALSNTLAEFFVMSAGGVTIGNLPEFSDTNGTIEDSGVALSNLMLLSQVNQLTGNGQVVFEKTNGTESGGSITLNGYCGIITTQTLNISPSDGINITWTNSFIATTSVILATWNGGTNTNSNFSMSFTAASGSATINITNNSGLASISGTILIGFVVL